MGLVQLPAAPPSGGGRMACRLELDEGELQTALGLLQGALAAMTSSSSAANGPVSAPQPAHHHLAPAPPPAPAAAAVATARGPPAATAAMAAQTAPQQPPRLARPEQWDNPHPPPQVQAAVRHPPPRVQAVPAAVPQPAPAPAPRQQQQQRARWQMVWATDPEEHMHRAVTALAYARELPGLPGGDGHSGWLVSAGQGVVNLWETARAAAGDEGALMCMHSQAVDVTITHMVLEPEARLMLGAALVSADGSECVSVHSLDVKVGLLAARYRFAPPPDRARSTARLLQQVSSLHGMAPGLRNSVVASWGDRLLTFEAKPGIRAASVLHDPTFHWVAHAGSVITAVARPQAIEGSTLLLSGAANGKVHIWDLKSPPVSNQPAARMYRHTQEVTGLAQVTDDRVVSSSRDGTVALWDLRRPASPLFTNTSPGGAAVLRLALGPEGDMLAVATAGGALVSVELFDFDAPMAAIAPRPLDRSYTDLAFNAVTHDLYAADSSGAVHVYVRRAR